MTRCLLLLLGLLAVCCDGQKKWDSEGLAREMETALAREIEARTGRVGVAIRIEAEGTKEGDAGREVRFSLSRRFRRDTLFSLALSEAKSGWIACGLFLNEAEQSAVRRILGERIAEAHFEVGSLGFGVVSVSCADLCVEPRREAGDNLASQLLLGTPITLLEMSDDGKFFRVQGALDGYLGWLHADDFTRCERDAWESWKKSAVLCWAGAGSEISPGTPVARTEDGRCLLFPDRAVEASEKCLSASSPQTDNVLATAKRFLPEGDFGPTTYLWGGSRSPNLDCSGFVQLVFRLNGILLPRDSDQQLQFCRRVEREGMRAGDLIFFSGHRRHPTHVGIYMGCGLYIHCSNSGPGSGVKIGDLAGSSEYDMYLNQIFYGAGRILP